ncbi:DUF2332 family protein [Paracoccus sp. Z330]|uniref:DUF2332 family protein n=1 Tax=Paracoccus onchidii TaxID=3017813 RepID=A0ABT4ZF21_9RHOB|nr:DUF2332 family protein [Paracoccus onchidii]MDB6177974.1 DUF2332 family protein [Paracoccus onchidii]
MSAAEVIRAFRDQASACARLGSPLTAALCTHLADTLPEQRGAVAERVIGWPGNPATQADSLPLRLAGALHALVLSGTDKNLGHMYKTGKIDGTVLSNALMTHADFILDWLGTAPQTNEVGRSAVIIAAARFLAGKIDLPLHTLELGASAGLNLNFAHYGLHDDSPNRALRLCPDWHGIMPSASFRVAKSEGVDLRPIDPVKDRLRLMAYCWADQDQRLARLTAALDLAAQFPTRVTAGDAGAWLHERLAHPAHGATTLVFHTVAAQYFPPDTLASCEAALQHAAAQTDHATVLAHLGMEQDGLGEGAGVTLRLWDGKLREWQLGRADFHGRWVQWQPEPRKGLGLIAARG